MKVRVIILIVLLAMLSVAALPMEESGTKLITAKALDDHDCDSSEWHFVITGISDLSLAPGQINVTWANGDNKNVPLDKVTGGTAHYYSYDNLDSTVTEASAEIYLEWNGQFNLSHGPCEIPEPTPTKQTPTESTPTKQTPEYTSTPTKPNDSTPTTTKPPDQTPTQQNTPTPTEPPPGGTAMKNPTNKTLIFGTISLAALLGAGITIKMRKRKF